MSGHQSGSGVLAGNLDRHGIALAFFSVSIVVVLVYSRDEARRAYMHRTVKAVETQSTTAKISAKLLSTELV